MTNHQNGTSTIPELQLRSTPVVKPRDSRIPDLDGVRGIAIWMVLLLHIIYGYPNQAGATNFIPSPIMMFLRHGWLGVQLFFMLSGFLITGILLGSKDGPHYFKNFYIRRVLRIMPLYFATVFVWSIIYKGYGSYFLLSSVFGANMAAPLGISVPHGPGVLWSLAVEEHFYLVWPLIVFLVNRRTLAVITAALFICAPILRGIFLARGVSQEFIYVCTWFQLDGLAAGALMAIWARSAHANKRTSLQIAGGLMVLLAILTVAGIPFGLLGTATNFSYALRGTQAYLIFAALFVLVVAYRGTIWTSPLRWRILQLSGLLSYCVYLVHLSVGDGYEYLLNRFGIRMWSYIGAEGALIARALFMIVVSFAIAMVSRKYLEEPFLALKDKFTEAGPLGRQT